MTPVLSLQDLSETILGEEAAEVMIELSKAKRFGWHDRNPLDGKTPMERISTELGDLLGAIDFFIETHQVDEKAMRKAALEKREKALLTNDPQHVYAWKQRVLRGEA